MITEEQIKELAHSIWEQEGRPENKDIEHYFRAKKILEAQEPPGVIELTPPPPAIPLDTPSQTAAKSGSPSQITGYCLKCRTKREMENTKAITMKNGKTAIQGTCPVCGTKISKIRKS